VRISAGIGRGRRWVLPALPAVAAKHPQLAIDLDLVAEGYDIGIRGGVIEDFLLIARRVCDLPLVLLARPAYLRRAGAIGRPAHAPLRRGPLCRWASVRLALCAPARQAHRDLAATCAEHQRPRYG